MRKNTFDDLPKSSLKSLYENRTIQSIGISDDFEVVKLKSPDLRLAEITISKKASDILIRTGLTKDIIMQASIVLLEDNGEQNRLRFYIDNYVNLGEVFEVEVNNKDKAIKINQTKIIAAELEKYWISSIE